MIQNHIHVFDVCVCSIVNNSLSVPERFVLKAICFSKDYFCNLAARFELI